jgi:hypothetical protein
MLRWINSRKLEVNMMTREVVMAGKLYAQGQAWILLEPEPKKKDVWFGDLVWLAVPAKPIDNQDGHNIYSYARYVITKGNFVVDYEAGTLTKYKITIMDLAHLDISKEPAEANEVEPTGETYSPYQDMDYVKGNE